MAKPRRAPGRSPAPASPTPSPAPSSHSAATPTIKRRLAALIYESMLLFAIVFAAGFLFSTLTQQRHALQYRHALQAWLFFVLAIYFIWMWCKSGQTLAMKTWHIRLENRAGGTISLWQALLRYLLAWIWVLPALALDAVLGLQGWASLGVFSAGIVLYAATAWLDPQRQFPHDRLAQTRLVLRRPPPKTKR
ncbi:RDD family protein [Imbroritus primus]|uniref:RDD family protein n=1 Tax=Imbroritus primus TaxID=3058603 RepID=A0ACD3SPI9_9BURK|nr:RDD family protein [Burkholderiaceae bacterium PBA]